MIIIETPAPPTRERLVLVPVDACNEVREDDPRVKFGAKVGLTVFACHARDATTADLARGGHVLREPGDYYAQWAAERDRARKAESDLAEVRELQRSDERDGNVGFSLTCWVESILEQLNVARINRTELGKAAGQYARERDEQRDRAARAERERDEALGRAQSETEWRVRAVSERQDAEAERDTLRAELARLTLADEEEPTDEALRDAFADAERNAKRVPIASALRVVYRLGVAHERARHTAPVTSGRATDEELFQLYRDAYGANGATHHEGVRAVAARVRQECLVAQAVAADCDIHVTEEISGAWCVRVVAPTGDAYGTPTVTSRADVPATLARLLGEVSRG